jgi:cellulose synthase/poly-beta-1,6-N-acetylglucosamine synthase-like glycosyltransferase
VSLPSLDPSISAFLAGLVVGFNKFVIVYFALINLGYLAIFLASLRALWRFVRRSFFADYQQIRQSDLTFPVSLLVPAHNETRTIVESLRSLLQLNYGEYEIIVINDGSTDETLKTLAKAFALQRTHAPIHMQLPCRRIKATYRSLTHPNIIVLDKERGGKADALNAGLNASRYPLFCSIDADSLIEEDALLRLVKPFIEAPQETIAAGGIVRVANGCTISDGRVTDVSLPRSRIAVMQVIEYLRAFLAGRAGWSAARSLLIISGAFGLYRKREIVDIGGYSDATDTEDAELVVRLHRVMSDQGRRYRIVFVPDPVCWTEVPETVKVLTAQRSRWHRGLLQTLWLYRGMMFRRKYGTVGMLGMPWFVAFELLGPVIEILGYIMVPLAWFLGILDRRFLVLFLIVAFVVGALLSVGALLLEEMAFRRYPKWRDLLRLLAYGFLENFGFRQYLSFIKVKALAETLWRRRGWGRMERRGFGAGREQPRPPDGQRDSDDDRLAR